MSYQPLMHIDFRRLLRVLSPNRQNLSSMAWPLFPIKPRQNGLQVNWVLLVAEYGVFQEMHMLPCLWRDSSKQIQRFLIASRQITIQHASQQHGVVRNYNICNLATTQVVDRNLQVGAPSQFLPDIHLGDGGSQLLVGSNAVRFSD